MDAITSIENEDVPHMPQGSVQRRLLPEMPTKGYFEAMLREAPELGPVTVARILLHSEIPEIRDLASEYYPQLWARYSSGRPQIRLRSLGEHAPWGIVFFRDGNYDYHYSVQMAGMVTANWETQVLECDKIIDEAQQVLSGNQRSIIVSQLINLIHMLFSAIDAVAFNAESKAASDRLHEVIASVEKRRKEAEAKVRELALNKDQRTAQQVYLLGMVPGLAVIAAVLASLVSSTRIGLGAEITIAAGSLGAVLSVLARTTRAQVKKSLDVDYQVGRTLIFFAGLFRPIVGALLAGALYVLINAGIIPLQIPAGLRGEYFFAAIAFLAGFSERLAQDALVRTAQATF